MSNQHPLNRYQQLVWTDLPDCAVILSPLMPSVDQGSVLIGGNERAALLLFREALVGMFEVQFKGVPDDATFIVVGRVVAAHQRACREGGEIL